MAVHTGEAQLRDDGNYLGQALNRCARIRATGHGGQILVSAATAALVADRLPAARRWWISGCTGSRTSGARSTSGSWSTLICRQRSRRCARWTPSTTTCRCSSHRSSVGSSEIAEVRAFWRRSPGDADRLGGGGQDPSCPGSRGRCARLASRRGVVGRAGPGGRSERRRSGRAGRARRPRGRRAPRSADQLAVALGDQPSLLVLDNCEHLVAACAELVAELLAANPSTSVLATSREPLGVPGEITWRVPSLRCPTPTHRSTPDAVAVRRRRRCSSSGPVGRDHPSWSPTPTRLRSPRSATASTASRWPSSWPPPAAGMSVERIAAELDDRFRLLTGGARTVDRPPADAAASVDWSYDLLDDDRADQRSAGSACSPARSPSRPPSVVAAVDDIEPSRSSTSSPPRRQEPRRRRRRTASASPATGCSRPLRATRSIAPEPPASSPPFATPTQPGGRTGCSPAATCPPTHPRGDLGVPGQPEGRPRLGRRPVPAGADPAERSRSGLGRLGRAGDAMAAADRLSPTPTPRCSGDGLPRPGGRPPSSSTRGGQPSRWRSRAHRTGRGTRGDEFYRRLARWPKEDSVGGSRRCGTWPSIELRPPLARPGCRSWLA